MKHLLVCKPEHSLLVVHHQVCKPRLSILVNQVCLCKPILEVNGEQLTCVQTDTLKIDEPNMGV